MIASKFLNRWEGGLNLAFDLNSQVVSWHGGGKCLWHLLTWALLSLLQLIQASPETTVSPSVFLFQDACWHPQGGSPCPNHRAPERPQTTSLTKFCTSLKDLEKPTVGLRFLETQATESSCVLASAWCAPRLRTSGRASGDKTRWHWWFLRAHSHLIGRSHYPLPPSELCSGVRIR